MSEELTKVKHAEKADELANYKQITLDGDVTGEIEAKQDGTQGFNGSEDVKITTTITGGDISKTTIEITELSGVDEEEIQSKEITGKLLYKIKNKFEDIEKGLENKLEKTATATSAEKLSEGKNISLVGNVKGTVVFDGSKDVEIQTEITGGDIKDTVVSYIEEISDKEELLQDEKISKILGKIKRSLKELDEHMENKSNPHEISKEQLGLGNVENTSDLEKPINNATQSVLDNKLDKTGNAVSASNADMLDGQHGSYYAPIENPIFIKDVEVQGNIKVDKEISSSRFINTTMNYTTKNYYEIDLSKLDIDTWYPVMLYTAEFECDCEIHSQSYGIESKYNQNSIHFLLQYYGWKDTPRRFTILNYGCYQEEYTIGYIVAGEKQGNKAVYVRGGLLYKFITNAIPELQDSKYIYEDEVYEPSKNLGEGIVNATMIWNYNDTPSNCNQLKYGISKFNNIYGTQGIFTENVEVNGILKTAQRKMSPTDMITRTSINNDESYACICKISWQARGTIYLYCNGSYIEDFIEIKILGGLGGSLKSRLQVIVSKHVKEHGIKKIYIYADDNSKWDSDIYIYVQFKQYLQYTNNIHFIYGDIICDTIKSNLSFVELLPKDKKIVEEISINSDTTMYSNIEQTGLTPAVTDNSNKLATTEFVYNLIKQYLGK